MQVCCLPSPPAARHAPRYGGEMIRQSPQGPGEPGLNGHLEPCLSRGRGRDLLGISTHHPCATPQGHDAIPHEGTDGRHRGDDRVYATFFPSFFLDPTDPVFSPGLRAVCRPRRAPPPSQEGTLSGPPAGQSRILPGAAPPVLLHR